MYLQQRGYATGFEAPPRIEVRPQGSYVRVVPSGEFDLAMASRVDEQLTELLDAGSERILLDLRDVSFMDSSIVHAILVAHVRAYARGGWLLISRPSAPVRRLLALTGADRQLVLAQSLQAAHRRGDESRRATQPGEHTTSVLDASNGMTVNHHRRSTNGGGRTRWWR